MRRHKSDEFYTWERVADTALHEQHLIRYTHKPTTHVWALEIDCYLANRKRDIDNTLKAGIDFIAGFFCLSDNYLDSITIKRLTDKENPRWQVKLHVPGA